MSRRGWAAPLAFALAVGLARPAPAKDAPPWFEQAWGDTAVASAGAAPAVDLLREVVVTVAKDGSRRCTARRALRVRDADGRAWASDDAFYNSASGRVADARAWRITPAGAVSEFGHAKVVDRAVDPSSLYDEVRSQELDLGGEVVAGDVVGWEWVVEQRDAFLQDVDELQGALPVRLSRYVLHLPDGWRAASVTSRHESLVPRVTDATWTWEARDLGDLRQEPSSPPLAALAPRLAVSWFPPAAETGARPVFHSWPDVGRWITALCASRADADDALRARAADLTRGAATDLERLRRVGRYVQDLPYAAIDIDLGRGAGMQPRPATQVLRQGYGDCKDKANLVRALLRESGVPSWLVAIYSGDPDHVEERWAAPSQFNHCIVAVRAPWATGLPAVVESPALGRLLLFDPTDPMTPVGGVPRSIAGGLALIQAGDSSALLRVPELDAATDRLSREVRGTIDADGALRATLIERSLGDVASTERALHRGVAPDVYRRTLENWVSQSVNGARVTDVRVRDDRDSSAFELTLAFEAPRYAARLGEQLLTLRPALVSRRAAVRLGDGARRLPVEVAPQAWEETATLRLPAGWAVDELPEPATLTSSFARYESRCEVRGDTLSLTRRLVARGEHVPAARFAEVKDFYLRVVALDQAPVVLKAVPGR